MICASQPVCSSLAEIGGTELNNYSPLLYVHIVLHKSHQLYKRQRFPFLLFQRLLNWPCGVIRFTINSETKKPQTFISSLGGGTFLLNKVKTWSALSSASMNHNLPPTSFGVVVWHHLLTLLSLAKSVFLSIINNTTAALKNIDQFEIQFHRRNR
jgi:hypothetical protein